MGNSNNGKLDTFYMHIQLIGENMSNFILMISGPNTSLKAKQSNRKFIEDYWDFDYSPKISLKCQVDDYFNILLNNKKSQDKTKNIRESLIVKIKNTSDPLIETIINKMNELRVQQYMPLVLFLTEESNNNKIIINPKYNKIDPRTIFVEIFSDDISSYQKNEYNKIKKTILRFCSIHNELGDRFTIGEKENAQYYDLIENYFPFNLNIACIGRIGQGKSTGVNSLLKSYKAKESKKGGSQTKNLTFYQVDNKPIRILDIPGFEDSQSIKDAIEKFKSCGEKINKIKDNLHIILYFCNYHNERTFYKFELPMIEEIIKHKSSKIIYVITHYQKKEEDDEEEKEFKDDFIGKINSGIQEISKDSINKEIINKYMLASLDNTIFVDFHRTNYNEVGTTELFNTIGNFFITSEDYISSSEALSENQIEERVKILRERANDILFSNKIGGGIVGLLPVIDCPIQKFYIKKNAAKKAGQIFGIDIKFIEDEEEEKNKKNNSKESVKVLMGNEKETIELNMELNGEEIIEENEESKEKNKKKSLFQGIFYIGGEQIIEAGIEYSSKALSFLNTTVLKVIGVGVCFVGGIIGVVFGGYFTHLYCEELLDKFEDYYKKNINKISNSYNEAKNYFS